MSFGCIASTRAIATRCCWPPESRSGNASNLCPRPTLVSISPLTGSINYGYVVARMRTDDAIRFDAYDYTSHSLMLGFAVKADGTPAPL